MQIGKRHSNHTTTTMSTWYYYDNDGQKQGPYSGGQLKWLAKNGKISSETVVETEEGKTAPARKVKGLTFIEAAQPKTSPAPSHNTSNPFASAPPASINLTAAVPTGISVPVEPVSMYFTESLQVGGGKAVASLICGIGSVVTLGGFLIVPIIGFVLGILGLKSNKSGIAIAGIVINVVAFLLCLPLIAFWLSAVQASRESAQRMQCANHIKQIVLALHMYADKTKETYLPPLYTIDKNGKPLHSWRVFLLPYLEQQELFNKIRLDEPWDSPHNSQFHNQMPNVYSCPRNPGKGCSYVAIAGVFVPVREENSSDRSTIMFAMKGTRNQMIIIEVKEPFNWMDPTKDITLDELAKGVNSGGRVGSFHAGSCFAGFGDGWVRAIPDSASKTILRSLGDVNARNVNVDSLAVVPEVNKRLVVVTISAIENIPLHGATYEIWVNGQLIDSTDKTDAFWVTTIEVPDESSTVEGRVKYKNGYGAVMNERRITKSLPSGSKDIRLEVK